MKKLHALLFALLPIAALPPLPAQAALTCDSGFCVQAFYYTGTPQVYQVPEGIGTIRYEIYGASGARGGGGALAQGYLKNLPSQLIIEVGGAGPLGAFRPGGYNGGGASGGSRMNEGAGGGASDIRLSPSLSSRIVVAGGGGGGGGFAGGAGGAAGLIGTDGVNGQGIAGKGGSATSGGAAGVNNSAGYSPTDGQFGLGGAGGSGLRAGGGGGGGGWYGGGGGGGDDDETGADGGGGGGGSSYAHPDHVDNPSFESGVNWGHGRVLLYYQLVPTATTFSGGQVNQNEMSFDLIMNQYIQDLTPDDFVFSSGTCEIYEIAVNLSVANIRARNCSHGEIGLTLKPRSVGELERGPLTSQTAWASNDRQGPTLTMTAPAGVHSTSEIVIPFSFSELTPSTESFSLPGCDAQIRESSLVLTNCASGSHQVSVRSFIADDFWGNSGPIPQTVQFSVDHTAPALSFSATVSGTTSFSYELALHFSETVVIAPDAISFSSSMTCSPLATNLSQECGYGEVSWRINTASITDLVGYPVGSEIIEVSLSNPEPVISQAPSVSESIVQVVNPEPAVTPQPTEPGPSPDPGPAIVVPPTPTQEIQTSSDSVTVPSESEPVTQSPTEPAIELEIEPVIQEPWLPSWSEEVEVATLEATTMRPRIQVREQSKEPAASEIPASKSDITPEVESQPREEFQTVAGPKLEIESEDSWPWLEISVAVLLIGLIGFGAYRTIGR